MSCRPARVHQSRSRRLRWARSRPADRSPTLVAKRTWCHKQRAQTSSPAGPCFGESARETAEPPHRHDPPSSKRRTLPSGAPYRTGRANFASGSSVCVGIGSHRVVEHRRRGPVVRVLSARRRRPRLSRAAVAIPPSVKPANARQLRTTGGNVLVHQDAAPPAPAAATANTVE